MNSSPAQTKDYLNQDQEKSKLDFKEIVDQFVLKQFNVTNYQQFKNEFWAFIKSHNQHGFALSVNYLQLIEQFCSLSIISNKHREITNFFLNIIYNNTMSDYAKSEYIQYTLGLKNRDEIGVENPITSHRENEHKKTARKTKKLLLKILEPETLQNQQEHNLDKYDPLTTLSNIHVNAAEGDLQSLLKYYQSQSDILLLKKEIDKFKKKYSNDLVFQGFVKHNLDEVKKYLDIENYSVWQACHKLSDLCQEGVMTCNQEYLGMYNFILDIVKSSQRRGLDLDRKEKGIVLKYLFDLGTWEAMDKWLKFLEQLKINALKPDSNQY